MYVIAKQGYGKERFYSVIRQGSETTITWTESLSKAERFDSEENAALVLGSQFMPNTVRYLKRVEV